MGKSVLKVILRLDERSAQMGLFYVSPGLGAVLLIMNTNLDAPGA